MTAMYIQQVVQHFVMVAFRLISSGPYAYFAHSCYCCSLLCLFL